MDACGYSAGWLARACGVDLSTARRWKRLGLIPPRYVRLVQLADGADLGSLSAAWCGWRLFRDELVNPEGERFAVNQVRALRLHQQLAAELERQLRRVTESAGAVLRPRELVIRVRLTRDELEGAAAGVVSVAHLESPDSPN